MPRSRTCWALAVAVAASVAGCGGGVAASFAGMLARTAVVLVAVGALAVVTLRLAARAGVGVRPARPGQARLEVVDEVPLGQRQSIVAVRAGGRVLLIGRTAQSLTPLVTLEEREWVRRGFSSMLAPSPVAPGAVAPDPEAAVEGGVEPADTTDGGRDELTA